MFIRHKRRVLAFVVLAAMLAAPIPWLLRPVAASETAVVSTRLINAAASLNSAGSVKLGSGTMSRCRETAVYIVWSAGAGAGAVKVESAVDENYAGTWAPLATVSWSAASKQDIVQITGVHWAIRTRISTAVTGGTVTTYAVCN